MKDGNNEKDKKQKTKGKAEMRRTSGKEKRIQIPSSYTMLMKIGRECMKGKKLFSISALAQFIPHIKKKHLRYDKEYSGKRQLVRDTSRLFSGRVQHGIAFSL